jgi:acyl-CoA thioesterase I
MLHRRQLLRALGVGAASIGVITAGCARFVGKRTQMLTVYTFGDSILDCGHYNQFGVHPGQLLVRNDDKLFPEFRGQDLSANGPTQLVHRAQDGATVAGLARQTHDLSVDGKALAILTIGGNDLLRGLARDSGEGIPAFRAARDQFLGRLLILPVLVGNVYNPTFGDDARNFLGIDPPLARANHAYMNIILAKLAQKYGALVDLHAHFLTGDPSWFTHTIEPSLKGASEVRRCFLRVANTVL